MVIHYSGNILLNSDTVFIQNQRQSVFGYKNKMSVEIVELDFHREEIFMDL